MPLEKRQILEKVGLGEIEPAKAAALLRSLANPPAAAAPASLCWFAPQWEVAEPASAAATPRPILVCSRVDGPRPATAQMLGAHEREARLAGSPSRYRSFADPEFAAFVEALAYGSAGPLGVLYVASERGEAASIQAALELSHMLLGVAGERGVALVYLYSTSGSTPDPMHAAVAGLARTICLENPAFRFRVVRTDDLDGGERIQRALRELDAIEDPEFEVRYCEGRRLARRVRPVPVAPEGRALRRDGVYLLAGGAGGLGRLFAEHLARTCNARVVLTGRSHAGSVEDFLSRLRTLGGDAMYVAGDLARPDDARRVVAAARSRFGPIHGVMHAAGIVDDGWLLRKSRDSWDRVLAPKVDGAVNLDEATSDEPLDFFTMFSSLVSLTGNAGQSDYACANRFLDEFAAARHARQLEGRRSGKTLSINWPHWRDGGMALPDTWRASGARPPLLPLLAADGLIAFELALASDSPQLAVACGEAAAVEAWMTGATRGASLQLAAKPVPAPPPAVRGAEANALLERTERYLAQLVSRVVGLPADRVRPEDDLEIYGIDSVAILQANDGLEQDFGPLSKTLFFEHRNLRSLARYFERNHAARLHAMFGTPDSRSQPAGSPPENREPAGPRRFLSDSRRDEAARGHDSAAVESEPLAVIGVAGRYPMAGDLEQFWENLKNGQDCIVEVPPSRWDHSRYFDPRPDIKGKSYSKWGGFIDGVDEFDPLFFSISPREARIMDPQERLFLETAWMAIEDAGYTPEALTGSGDSHRAVGVFVGVMYGSYQLYAAEAAARGVPAVASSAYYTIANRVSYVLDLRGPSMAIDTACSSSLVALHLACESIRRGECRLAIAGGVNVTIHPSKYLQLSEGKFASTDGRCRSFGEGGDGYVPGEGVGAILLKPLGAALADGDHVYGIVRATAVNHGGKTNGYTVPNPDAHAELVNTAIRRSAVDARTITYLEAHGTGTALGDPIEIAGLTKAFAGQTRDLQFCALGSVKSNIGHLESAAGIAAVTKVLLQMKHRALVSTLHAARPNPHLDLASTPFFLQQEYTDWRRPALRIGGEEREYPRRAGVSSFGAGGSNAHVILEEYEPDDSRADEEPAPWLFLLSAKSPEQLHASAANLQAFLAGASQALRLGDVAFTLQVGRQAMAHRFAAIASDRTELIARLGAFRSEQRDDGMFTADGRGGGDLLGDTPEATAFLEALWTNGRLAQIARLWVHGVNVPWLRLRAGRPGRRVALPSYPFARKKYWIQTVDEPPAPAAEGLHPLIDAVVPSLDGAVLRKRFSGREPYVRDHRLNDRPTLPGVACVAMAHAAAQLLNLGRVTVMDDIVWVRPMYVDADGTEARLSVRRHGDALQWRLTSPAGLHSHGGVHTERERPLEPAVCDTRAVQSRCPVRIARRDLYRLFASRGLAYGDSMQGIAELWTSGTEVLARIDAGRPHQSVLYPPVLDAALHAVAGLLAGDPSPVPLEVPASLDAFEIHDPEAAVAYVHAVRASAVDSSVETRAFHVDLADELGRIVGRFRNLQTKVFQEPAIPAEQAADPRATYYQVRWTPATELPLVGRVAGGLAIIGPPDVLGLDHELARLHPGHALYRIELGDRYEECSSTRWTIDRRRKEQYDATIRRLPAGSTVYFVGAPRDPDGSAATRTTSDHMDVLSLLYTVQCLRSAASGAAHDLVVVTWNAHRVVANEVLRPGQSALVGFARSASVELPDVHIRCVDVEAPTIANEVEAALRDGTDPETLPLELAIRGGSVYRKQITELLLPEVDDADVPLRPHGVYLIVGGARGIGREVAKYLARTVRARVAIVGRSPVDRERQRTVDELRALGGDAEYWQADATDEIAMRRVVEAVSDRWGSIAGVVHSALALNDRAIEHMDDEAFRTAFDPKVTGSVVLHEVTRDLPLDFLLFFSSGNTFIGAAGQSNYAAGCAFEDAFALALRHAHGRPAHVVNWGFWGQVGAVATDEYRRRMARRGIGSITPEEGLEAIRRVLGHGVDQALVISLHAASRHKLAAPHEVVRMAAARSPLVRAAVDRAAQALAGTGPADPLFPPDLHAMLLARARTSLLAALNGAGAEIRPGSSCRVPAAEAWMGVTARHRRLFAALLRSLERGGLVTIDGDRVTFTAAAERSIIAAAVDPDGAVPAAFVPHAHLLAHCVEHLPAVLRGAVPATDVLFPASSLELVEQIYRGNPAAERFNRIAAETVRLAAGAMLNESRASAPLRILEIGAGTGGTSAAVLDGLRPLADRVRYVYTDVSPRFVQYGKRLYEPVHPFTDFRTLDIERDVDAQGFQDHACDIVLAANVLHATRDIGRTLNEIKRLLKANGLLIVLEGTALDDFMTFTFGLLDGWWHAEDEHLRIADSPLLNVGGWTRAMESAGFRHVVAFDEEQGQTVFVAESNGLATVRREAMPSTEVMTSEAEPVAIAPPRGAAPASVADGSLRALVEERISEQVIAAFGLDRGDLDPDKRFSEYGADSIVSVELVNLLNETLHLRLKPPVLFDHSSIRELTSHIVSTFGSQIATDLGASHVAPPPAAPETTRRDALEDVLMRLESGAISLEEALKIAPDLSPAGGSALHGDA